MRGIVAISSNHQLCRSLLALICTWSAVAGANGQTIDEKFKRYRQQVAQEKMYVHTDRELYITGENLWLKIYTVDGAFHRPSDMSHVAYVELMTESGDAVVQAKVSLSNGQGSGTVFLPATLNSGKYLLRAYTRWMKNFDSEFFFQKTITIVNTFIRLDVSPTATAGIEAHFFPEGGQWIAGVEGRVGFKVTDDKGRSVAFRGSLINEQNDTLLHFRPFKFGMGNFSFTPSDTKYRAVITVDRQQKVFDLPRVSTSGYSMSVVEEQGKVRVRVSTKSEFSGLSLFVHARQIIARSMQLQIVNGVASFELPVNEFPEGISHITIFNTSQQPVCERLYFRRPAHPLEVAAGTDKKEYGTRKPVTLNIKSADKSSLSVAVYRLDSLSDLSRNGILEYLWLSSDLKGFIEEPEFYFNDTDEARIGADNLMMTQGWRKFNWNDVLNANPVIQFAPEYQGHVIEGTVKNQSGEPAPRILTYLASPDKIINTYGSRSDKDGKVRYVLRNMYGPRKLVMYNDTTCTIELQSPFSKNASARRLPPFRLNTGTEGDLLTRSIWMQAQDIYFGETIRPVRFDSTAFYGRPDEKYLLDDYTRFPVMEEILREYVPGVMVRKQRDGYRLVLLNDVTKKLIASSPTVLIDGVPVFDINKVLAFDPLRVNKLEVVNRHFYSGNSIFYGLVSFTTYTGDMAGFPLDHHYTTINFDGLNLAREFYSPDHEKKPAAFLPDQRSLLYWNPDVTGNVEGSSLKFHTSDLEGRYAVIVEGLSGDGRAGRTTYEFTVRK